MMRLLRRRYVVVLLLGAMVGRLVQGMVGLGLALFVRGDGQAWASAGQLVGVYAVGTAIGTPILSRWMDRRGQPLPLLSSAVISAAALGALPLAPHGASALLALAAGAATPPLEPALRSLWPSLVEPADLPRAYALDAACQGLIFVVGPVLVLGAVHLSGPASGLALAAATTAAGCVAFVAAPPPRRWRPAPVAESGHWLGPLRRGRFVGLLLSFCLLGLTMGSLAVTATALAEEHGDRTFGGWLVTANSVGGLVGGFLFASASRRLGPGTVTAPRLLTLFGLGWLLLLVPLPLDALVVPAILSGVLLPAALSTSYLVVDRLAPAGSVSEAFGWMITSFFVGQSVGGSMAGFAAGAGTVSVAVVIAAVSSLLSAVVAATVDRDAGDRGSASLVTR
jgi:MFS family permease